MTTSIITADDAYPLFRAAMDRVDGKEAIFVLPLDADGRKITNPTLVAGAELLGVRLLDHLIIGSPESEDGRGFVSILEQMEDDVR